MEEEIGQKVFQQVIAIWINPEIEKRKELGKIDEDFKLTKAQIIFSLDKGNEVRLNDEIKAIAKCKANKPYTKGEIVYDKDIDDIEKIELTDDDVNCAHITLLLFKNHWKISFDSRYNKSIAQEHIKASKEFYESAKDNLTKNRLRPFFENAFTSAELSAKSFLLTFPDKEILIRKHKVHSIIKSRYRDQDRLGNVKSEHSIKLSELSSLRSSARFLRSDKYKDVNHPEEIIHILKEMIDSAERSIK